MAVYRWTFLWQHTGQFTFLIQKWGMKAQVNGEQGVRIWKLVMCDHYTWYMWQNDVIRDVSGVQIIYTNSNHSEIMMSVMSLFGWHTQSWGGIPVIAGSLYISYLNLSFGPLSIIYLKPIWEESVFHWEQHYKLFFIHYMYWLVNVH